MLRVVLVFYAELTGEWRGIMIKVTKLNGDIVYINSNLIEFIEEIPDTMITLTTGKKIILKDDVEDIIDRIIEYNRKISN